MTIDGCTAAVSACAVLGYSQGKLNTAEASKVKPPSLLKCERSIASLERLSCSNPGCRMLRCLLHGTTHCRVLYLVSSIPFGREVSCPSPPCHAKSFESQGCAGVNYRLEACKVERMRTTEPTALLSKQGQHQVSSADVGHGFSLYEDA